MALRSSAVRPSKNFHKLVLHPRQCMRIIGGLGNTKEEGNVWLSLISTPSLTATFKSAAKMSKTR